MNNILQKFFQSKRLDWAGIFVFLTCIFQFLFYDLQLEDREYHTILQYPLAILLISGLLGPYVLLVLYSIGLFYGVRHKIRLFLLFLCLGYVMYVSYQLYEVVLAFNKIQF